MVESGLNVRAGQRYVYRMRLMAARPLSKISEGQQSQTSFITIDLPSVISLFHLIAFSYILYTILFILEIFNFFIIFLVALEKYLNVQLV